MSQDLHEEEALGNAYDARLLRRLWRYVSPYRWQVVATIAMVAPIFALEVAPAWIIKSGLDAATGVQPGEAVFGGIAAALEPPAGWSRWVWLSTLYLVTVSALGALQFGHLILMARTGQLAMRDLRRDVFGHIQKLHLGFFDHYPVGRVVTRATNDVENVSEMFSSGIVALVTDVAKMVGFAVVLFAVSAKLSLATFAVVPVLAIGAVIFRYKVRTAFRKVRVRIARINAHIQETITGMKVVQLFTREVRNMRDFDAMNADHRDAWHESIRYDSLLFSTVEAAQGVTIAVIVWYGTGLAEAGVLYLFIDYMARFFMPLRDLSQKYSVMQSSLASAERIFHLLDMEPEIQDPEPSSVLPAASQGAAAGRGAIEFDHVWFAYGGEDWVLRDVSFRAKPGERLAFVGATGAGKTTIISLLTRLYEVTRGAIRIDGVDIREMPQSTLRRRVATVLQDVFLFSGSLADNISLGRPGVTPEAVRDAARAVQADGFIAALPDGYQTEVREGGSNFSSGQRQLLSFARALAHGADILVLDEATSAIDTETELLIRQAIHLLMEGRTAIAIAHRLSTVRDADRIYVLDQGQIVESGSHDELIARGGFYRRLYHLQMIESPTAETSVTSPLGD